MFGELEAHRSQSARIRSGGTRVTFDAVPHLSGYREALAGGQAPFVSMPGTNDTIAANFGFQQGAAEMWTDAVVRFDFAVDEHDQRLGPRSGHADNAAAPQLGQGN